MVTRLTIRLALVLAAVRLRFERLIAEPERGNTPEQTALTALLVLMAVTVVGIITAVVTGAARSLSIP
jgi:hypothetical protein